MNLMIPPLLWTYSSQVALFCHCSEMQAESSLSTQASLRDAQSPEVVQRCAQLRGSKEWCSASMARGSAPAPIALLSPRGETTPAAPLGKERTQPAQLPPLSACTHAVREQYDSSCPCMHCPHPNALRRFRTFLTYGAWMHLRGYGRNNQRLGKTYDRMPPWRDDSGYVLSILG